MRFILLRRNVGVDIGRHVEWRLVVVFEVLLDSENNAMQKDKMHPRTLAFM